MNGIDKITARIAEDCQKEADAILAEAKTKAAEITARYKAQAEAEARVAQAEAEEKNVSTNRRLR